MPLYFSTLDNRDGLTLNRIWGDGAEVYIPEESYERMSSVGLGRYTEWMVGRIKKIRKEGAFLRTFSQAPWLVVRFMKEKKEDHARE